MICVKSQTKEKWVNEGWHQPIALEERHVTASGAPGGCGPHGERHAPPPSHGYFQEQRLRWAIVPSHRRSLPVIETQMWVVLPRFTVIAANFACLWMRSPVSQRCEQRTHTVCLPDAALQCAHRQPHFSSSRCPSSLSRNLTRIAGLSFCADGVSVRSHGAMSGKCQCANAGMLHL